MICFVSFRRGSRPEVYSQYDACNRIIGKVLKERINVGGVDIPSYSPGKGLFQVSIEGSTSYLAVGDRIVSAPRGAVFVQALLPIILPILYPLPELPEPLRIARVFYPKMGKFLPRAVSNRIMRLRRPNPWMYLDKTQLSLVERSGGVPVFIPVFADRDASQRRYAAFKIEQHFGYAVQCVSRKSKYWYSRLTTIGSLKNFDVGNANGTELLLKLTAEMSDPPPMRLPKSCAGELIEDVVRRRKEWLRYIDRETLSNIQRLFV